MALPVSRLHGAQHGAAYYFSLKYRYVYLRSVRIKRTGVVHAKVGQIVTFFAYCPPTGYGWLRGEEDPWSDALGASYALDQSARPLSGGPGRRAKGISIWLLGGAPQDQKRGAGSWRVTAHAGGH